MTEDDCVEAYVQLLQLGFHPIHTLMEVSSEMLKTSCPHIKFNEERITNYYNDELFSILHHSFNISYDEMYDWLSAKILRNI